MSSKDISCQSKWKNTTELSWGVLENIKWSAKIIWVMLPRYLDYFRFILGLTLLLELVSCNTRSNKDYIARSYWNDIYHLLEACKKMKIIAVIFITFIINSFMRVKHFFWKKNIQSVLLIVDLEWHLKDIFYERSLRNCNVWNSRIEN